MMNFLSRNYDLERWEYTSKISGVWIDDDLIKNGDIETLLHHKRKQALDLVNELYDGIEKDIEELKNEDTIN